MTAALVILALAGLAAWAGYQAASQVGAHPALIAIRRYGALLALPLLPLSWAGLALALRGPAEYAAHAAILVAVLAVATGPGKLPRRAVIRCRWPSVARACGLTVTRDRRPGRLLGATTTIVGQTVEHMPAISHGRAIPGGCAWRLTPARGATIGDVADVAEAITAALKVHSVTVGRDKAHRGQLTVLWGDTLGVITPTGDLTEVAP